MSVLGTKLRKADGGAALFRCPGCKQAHAVYVEPPSSNAPNRPTWGFNGDGDRTTFTPSVLVRNGHYVPGYDDKKSCWCSYNVDHPNEPAPFKCGIFHSFVKDGCIQFLSDCTHVLAGQTVEMPDWTEKGST